MGKVRGLRARVHLAAVRPAGESAVPAPPGLEGTPARASAGRPGQAWTPLDEHVFAGTRIEPDALVQTLRPEAAREADAEPKGVLTKKEKLKLRRERWLQKIEAIKMAELRRQAERRRKATPVVGDLQPLRDALPQLLDAQASGLTWVPRPSSSVKTRPAELSRMSARQRLQLLEEECTRFQALLASPSYRACPLRDIGCQLAQQMRLEAGPP